MRAAAASRSRTRGLRPTDDQYGRFEEAFRGPFLTLPRGSPGLPTGGERGVGSRTRRVLDLDAPARDPRPRRLCGGGVDERPNAAAACRHWIDAVLHEAVAFGGRSPPTRGLSLRVSPSNTSRPRLLSFFRSGTASCNRRHASRRNAQSQQRSSAAARSISIRRTSGRRRRSSGSSCCRRRIHRCRR
jgi:hypothetical protein